MKTLALAGFMTVSAVMGSALTLTLSQASFAQDDKPDDRHWTQQRASANPAPQSSPTLQSSPTPQSNPAPSSVSQKAPAYTEYKVVRVDKGNSANLSIAVSNEMIDGWQPVGGIFLSCGNWDCKYFQSMVR